MTWKKNGKLRIAIDFDGVIHDFRSGFTTASDTPGAVHPQALKFVKDAIGAGHSVVIHSGRSCGPSTDNEDLPFDDGGKAAIEKFLNTHGFPDLRVSCRKPNADIFIDDLGYRFTGRFPSLKKLEKLKPWYLRSGLENQHGNTEDHEQEILTPSSITDFVRELFNEAVNCDPCAARDERDTVRATHRYFGGESDNGLVIDWPDATFVNPPYGKLKDWLAKAVDQALNPDVPRIVVLCPVRSNRTWWRKARAFAQRSGAYVELNPVAFVGYDAAFPSPLCLMCFNVSRSGVQQLVARARRFGEVA